MTDPEELASASLLPPHSRRPFNVLVTVGVIGTIGEMDTVFEVPTLAAAHALQTLLDDYVQDLKRQYCACALHQAEREQSK